MGGGDAAGSDASDMRQRYDWENALSVIAEALKGHLMRCRTQTEGI